MEQNRTLFGIGFMLLFCTLAPLGDALAKILGQTVALGPLIFIRFAIQVIILAPMALAIGGSWHFSGKFLTLSAIRTVLQITGIAIMVVALQYLPLADAVAIVFILPLLVILLGWAVLKEDVSKERLLACVVGFIGTLMVIQPSFQEVGFYALLPLLVAFIFAIFMLITRFITQENDVIKVQTVNGVMAVFLIAPALLIFKDGSVPLFDFSTISSDKIFLLISFGSVGTFALLSMTWSLSYLPSATTAPLQYLEIPIVTLFGWLLFSELPNPLASAGIVITMASGLYVMFQEQAKTAQRPAQQRPAQDVIAAE